MKKIITTAMVAVLVIAGSAVAAHHGDKGKKFQKLDTNGDGIVSKSEFLAKAEQRFAEIDADHNGSITQEEMKSHHKEMKKKFRKRLKERLEEKDD